MRPFVYRRYLDFGVFESLREMKALIAREVARRDLEQDLKLGRGGIREIEFIVQSMQLVRGGSDRRLQNAALLEVMPMLVGSKLLTGEEVAQLTDAYFMLRKAENALQMMRDEQAAPLPGRSARPRAPVRRTGCCRVADGARAHRRRARKVARPLRGAGCSRRPDTSAETARPASAGWIRPDDDMAEELAQARISARRDRGSGAAARSLSAGGALSTAGRDRPAARARHPRRGCSKTAALKTSPATMIERVLRVLDAIGARSSYLALLKEQPAALDRLIDVCAISGFLARQIADFPLLLDELIDAKAFDELPSRERFARELAARTERLPADDPGARGRGAARISEGCHVLGRARRPDPAAAADAGERPADGHRRAHRAVLHGPRLGADDAIHGVPRCGERDGAARAVKVAVAGYGKLGGLELGYGSDLDLVFLHDSAGEFQQTTRRRWTTACSFCGSGSASCICSPCTRPPGASTKSICVCGRTARVDS